MLPRHLDCKTEEKAADTHLSGNKQKVWFFQLVVQAASITYPEPTLQCPKMLCNATDRSSQRRQWFLKQLPLVYWPRHIPWLFSNAVWRSLEFQMLHISDNNAGKAVPFLWAPCPQREDSADRVAKRATRFHFFYLWEGVRMRSRVKGTFKINIYIYI